MADHRRPPAPSYPSRLWLGLMAAAVTGIVVPPTVLAAQSVAPHVVADEHLALTVERPAEPSAHGGPLAPLSIGVVAPETDVPVVPPIVRAVTQASSHPVRTRAVPPASVASPTETPAASSAAPVQTTPTITAAEATTPVTTPAETTTPAPTTTAEPTVTDPSTTTTAITLTIWRHHHHG